MNIWVSTWLIVDKSLMVLKDFSCHSSVQSSFTRSIARLQLLLINEGWTSWMKSQCRYYTETSLFIKTNNIYQRDNKVLSWYSTDSLSFSDPIILVSEVRVVESSGVLNVFNLNLKCARIKEEQFGAKLNTDINYAESYRPRLIFSRIAYL